MGIKHAIHFYFDSKFTNMTSQRSAAIGGFLLFLISISYEWPPHRMCIKCKQTAILQAGRQDGWKKWSSDQIFRWLSLHCAGQALHWAIDGIYHYSSKPKCARRSNVGRDRSYLMVGSTRYRQIDDTEYQQYHPNDLWSYQCGRLKCVDVFYAKLGLSPWSLNIFYIKRENFLSRKWFFFYFYTILNILREYHSRWLWFLRPDSIERRRMTALEMCLLNARSNIFHSRLQSVHRNYFPKWKWSVHRTRDWSCASGNWLLSFDGLEKRSAFGSHFEWNLA